MLNDDLIKRTRHSVKNFKDKARILRNKGVSSYALPKVGTAKELLSAYKDDPKGLRKRLKELDEFSTKGKVFKTKGGVNLTQTVKNYKNREIRKSRTIEQAKLQKAERQGLAQSDYHLNRLERLQNRIESVKKAELASLNYATTSPEIVKNQGHNAVNNFMKAINFGLDGMDNDTFHDPNLAKRLRSRLERLDEDELNDLLENNPTVKSIMNYYREKDHKWVEFSGGSMDELLEELDRDLPNIIRHYRRLRK